MLIKKKVLLIILLLNIFIVPTVLAEREVGDNFTLTSEQYESCHTDCGTNFCIIYCVSDVPETMHKGSSFYLRNFFFFLSGFPSVAAILAVGVMLGLILVAGLFSFFPKFLDEEYTPIKLLFIVGALLLCLIILSFATQLVMITHGIAGASFNQIANIILSGYQVILWTVVLTLTWIIIIFIWRVLNAAKPR